MACVRFVIATAILLFALAEAKAFGGWKPVSARDLKLSPADVGDPDADAAILFRLGELNDNDPEGTNLRVYVRLKIFTERGRKYGEVHLPYNLEQGRITEVRARTVRPDGTAVDVASRDIYDKLVLKNQHGVVREKVFSLPGVEAGCIVEYRYRQTYPEGFRYFALDLQAELFIKELEYRIQPQSASRFDVRWIAFNAPDPSQFTFSWNGTYNMKAREIPPFRREPLMPPEAAVKMWGWLYYSKEKETVPEKYWRNYAERRHEVVSDETEPGGAIRRVVEIITLAGDDPRRKLQRIYEYVQTEVHNTTFEGAPSEQAVGLRNRTAEETLRRRFGTSSEINRLFVAMARAIGLDARIAELTTRDANIFNMSFLDSFQFNGDVAVVVQPDGALEFYDPGMPYCDIGMLPWEKEAVQALVYGRDDSKFAETPVTSVEANVERRRLVVVPDPDGGVEVQQEAIRSGQPAMVLRGEFAGLSADAQRRRVIRSLQDILPTAGVHEPSIKFTGISGSSGDVTISSRLTVPEFAPRTDKRLLLRPALLSHLDEAFLTAPTRTNRVHFRYPWTEIDEVVIEIPQGYEVDWMPAPISIDAGAATYHASFRQEGRRVIYERRLAINSIVVGAAKYPNLKEFFDSVHQADRTAIPFKR